MERLETGGGERLLARAALGAAGADAALKGGLALGSLHEVFASAGSQGAAATGFVLGLARRLTEGKRFVLWIRQDFSARESGELSMTGFAELGLDPCRVVVVRAPTAESVLRTAADGLACNALGAVVAEIWGETRAFDLVASRKLTLAAGDSGVTALMLRLGAAPQASTAETRWIVRAAHSPPVAAGRPGAGLPSTPNSPATVMDPPGDGSWNGRVMSTFSANGRRILSVWLPRLPTDRFRRLQRQGNAAAPDADSCRWWRRRRSTTRCR